MLAIALGGYLAGEVWVGCFVWYSGEISTAPRRTMWSIHAPYPKGSTALNPCKKTTTGSGSVSAARSGEKSQNPVGGAPTRSARTLANLESLPPGPDAG